MKNFILLFILLGLFSCNSDGILGKKFTYEWYEKLDYKKLLVSEKINDSELFLLNYAIIRQRDYFNYEIEGKSYKEILAMAGQFSKDGFPIAVNMNDNGKQDRIKQTVKVEDISTIRKKTNQKRRLKTLNFSCRFHNQEESSMVMLNSSFIVKGPFGDYLTTLNFDINCIIGAGEYVDIGFIVPSKVIDKNLKFEGNPLIQRLGIDNILNSLQIEPSGMSIQDQGRYFKECFFNAARLAPQVTVEFEKDLKDKTWKIQNSEGKYELDFGDMHIPADTDEVIQMR